MRFVSAQYVDLTRRCRLNSVELSIVAFEFRWPLLCRQSAAYGLKHEALTGARQDGFAATEFERGHVGAGAGATECGAAAAAAATC